MKRALTFGVWAASAACAFAAPTGDRPDDLHAWAVHDEHRPEAPKIDVPEDGVPSDAIRLFDGSPKSVADNWCGGNGDPTKWTVKDGCFVCTPGSGGAFTREHFGDCQLHVEFRIPDPPGEGRGNSGVILQSRYEVQVIDSHTVIPTPDPRERAWTRGDYADGQCAAIYGQHPPLVNATRAPGKWQSYDIIFHPPLFRDGKKVDSGSMTVLHNGVVVQDAWPLEGRCKWRYRADADDHVEKGPLRLQDHGHPVAYRNVWIRRLPSRLAVSANGGPGVCRKAVAEQRAKNHDETLAWAKTLTDPEKRLFAFAEAWAYKPNPETRKALDEAADACLKAWKDGKAKPGPHVGYFGEMCARSGIFPADGELVRYMRTCTKTFQ